MLDQACSCVQLEHRDTMLLRVDFPPYGSKQTFKDLIAGWHALATLRLRYGLPNSSRW